MARTFAQFRNDVSFRMAERATLYAKPKIPSRTLRAAIKPVRLRQAGSAAAWIPHYWARYVHDGFQNKEGQLRIWFRDPRKDPRLVNGVSPVFASRRKKLSKSLVKKLAADFRKNPKTSEAIFFSGRSKPVPESGFFDNQKGMAGFPAEANKIAAEEMGKYVKEYMDEDLNISL